MGNYYYYYYTGVGSREVPCYVEKVIHVISKRLAKAGYILRSGGAPGCDTAFELGCDMVMGEKEIYLPWEGFGNREEGYILRDERSFEIGEEYHPAWSNLSDTVRLLIARNGYQVLGRDLETPSKFVLCYTKGGLGSGGTGQAIRIAHSYDIPVFDFGKYTSVEDILENYVEFEKEHILGS